MFRAYTDQGDMGESAVCCDKQCSKCSGVVFKTFLFIRPAPKSGLWSTIL